MSEYKASEEQRDEHSSGTAREQPAIGVVFEPQSVDAIARIVLRATQQGQQVLVLNPNENDRLRTLDFIHTANVHLIDVPHSAEEDTYHQQLETAARTLGLPGVIIHDEPDDYIDREATLSAFNESGYSIDAIPQLQPDSGQSTTLVAIPAYNEAATIGEVVAEVLEHEEDVLVIDDGSTDATVEQARAAGATVLEREANGGYGAALKTAFREAYKQRAEQLIILDGDGQHDPADIPRLLAALRDDGADIAIGSRFAADSETTVPFYRRVGLAVINLLSNLSLGVVRSASWIDDTQSGFRAYNRRAIESLLADDEVGDRMSASTDILYHAHHNDYAIEEVGTTIDYDVENGSQHNPISHGVHLVMNIVKTVERDRPITFLGVPGFLSAFVGLGFGYWTISNFINSGSFPSGLAITSMFFVLIGIFACLSAVMLHALSTQIQ
ncbi:glycosyltransferase family 2 protein [Halococcus qingdaonensis]|uniref:glycosyltransferase family 2 protein n=1 Tax=Halococcus qingdaonensis TaxID=224402 RepID=UPI0021167B9E|nr:glycosyltransferase family 2 protein [Halococcus qingdaonensis]